MNFAWKLTLNNSSRLYLEVESITIIWSEICLTLSVVLTIIFFALPDLYQIINLLLILGIFVSPIAYKYEIIPSAYEFIIYYNPYETFLELYRSSFKLNNSEITLWVIIKNTLINLVFFIMALFFIKKSKRYIQDNV